MAGTRRRRRIDMTAQDVFRARAPRRQRACGALAALLSCALLALGPAEAKDVYRWKDADGVTHYSDSKPADTAAESLRFGDETASAPPADAPTLYKPPPAAPSRPNIVMYGRPSCGYCVKAARYFAANGLAFRNMDISASSQARAEFERLGGRGTPLIFVDGHRIQGFAKSKLDEVLGRR